MNDSVGLLVVLLFVPFFLAMWCGITFFIAAIGGWRSLAARYATQEPFHGMSWYMRTARMGFANYKGILTIGADNRGLYLNVFALFRIGHKPLFIPWDDIAVRERQGFLFPYLDFVFTHVPGVKLSLMKNLGDDVVRAAGRAVARA